MNESQITTQYPAVASRHQRLLLGEKPLKQAGLCPLSRIQVVILCALDQYEEAVEQTESRWSQWNMLFYTHRTKQLLSDELNWTTVWSFSKHWWIYNRSDSGARALGGMTVVPSGWEITELWNYEITELWNYGILKLTPFWPLIQDFKKQIETRDLNKAHTVCNTSPGLHTVYWIRALSGFLQHTCCCCCATPDMLWCYDVLGCAGTRADLTLLERFEGSAEWNHQHKEKQIIYIWNI